MVCCTRYYAYICVHVIIDAIQTHRVHMFNNNNSDEHEYRTYLQLCCLESSLPIHGTIVELETRLRLYNERIPTEENSEESLSSDASDTNDLCHRVRICAFVCAFSCSNYVFVSASFVLLYRIHRRRRLTISQSKIWSMMMAK